MVVVVGETVVAVDVVEETKAKMEDTTILVKPNFHDFS